MILQYIESKLMDLQEEAVEVLNDCGLEWKDEFLDVKNYSPEFDFGQEDKIIHFNLILGKMLMLFEFKEK